MRKLTYTIKENECNDLTYKLFMEMSGINKEGRKFQRMKDDAAKIREQIQDRIDIHIACHYYDNIEFKGRAVNIGGEIFTCPAFELIDPTTIKGAYVYALTAGEYDFKEQSIMNRLYADIWGTSFTEAARILLSREIGKTDKLSDSFGPGFFGMDVSQMDKVDKLIDFKQLGIKLTESKILIPVKSCAGIYFSITDNYKFLNRACVDCYGSETSCKLCRQRDN